LEYAFEQMKNVKDATVSGKCHCIHVDENSAAIEETQMQIVSLVDEVQRVSAVADDINEAFDRVLSENQI
jgi:hypothetical protein